ncbi:MAG: enoyl-CoA hydratase/isomerase family protein, partial [Acidimicrobiales bacterium]|nr:enoyl-CoA hydratase/isomerase family protein [Acidimicrobiales bacterium]
DADPAIVAERATAEGKFAQEKRMYVDRCVRIYEFPKPTIAAVQGRCIAAGLMLALVCDLVVAADDASFANPVARMSGMGVELLLEPWDLGIRKAKEFLWTGEPLGAADAAAAGMVNRVVPRAELADAARALAETIALVPPVTAERIKDSVNHTYELMGKRQSWQYHFMAHHFTHNTATALGMLADRQGMGSMREVFEARDRGDAPAS